VCATKLLQFGEVAASFSMSRSGGRPCKIGRAPLQTDEEMNHGRRSHRRSHRLSGVCCWDVKLTVEMLSSTRADTHDVPQWPFYFLARLVTVLHFGALSDRSTFIPTTRSRLFFATACLEGLVVVNEVPSLALCLCLLLLEMSWPTSNSSSRIKQKLVLQL
jgi:hypothetical protein